MQALRVPAGPEDHMESLLALLGPLAHHRHFRQIVRHLVCHKAPLLYSATHPDEHQNLSNWFGLVNDRAGVYEARYDDVRTQVAVRALYVAHELSHIVVPTPHHARARPSPTPSTTRSATPPTWPSSASTPCAPSSWTRSPSAPVGERALCYGRRPRRRPGADSLA